MHPLLLFACFFQFAGHGQRGCLGWDLVVVYKKSLAFLPFNSSKHRWSRPRLSSPPWGHSWNTARRWLPHVPMLAHTMWTLLERFLLWSGPTKSMSNPVFFFCSSSIVPYHFPPHPLVLSMPRRAVRGPCTPLSTLTCDPRDPCSFRYDAAAKKSGARIVHACGYDSIPSDLGALMGKCCHRCCHQCMLSQIIFEYITCIYILIVCHANTLLTIQWWMHIVWRPASVCCLVWSFCFQPYFRGKSL